IDRIIEIGRLDHVVLFVAAQPMLRAESGSQLKIAQRRQSVERMNQITRHRRWMRQQRYALAGKRSAQLWLFNQSVDAEFHSLTILSALIRKCELQGKRV